MSERSEPQSKSDESVSEHAVDLLSYHGAHLPFERAVADMPEHLRGVVPEGAASSLWQSNSSTCARPVGHPGVQPRLQPRVARVFRRLLARHLHAARRRLAAEHRRVPGRPRCNDRADQGPAGGRVPAHPARHRPDRTAAAPAGVLVATSRRSSHGRKPGAGPLPARPAAVGGVPYLIRRMFAA